MADASIPEKESPAEGEWVVCEMCDTTFQPTGRDSRRFCKAECEGRWMSALVRQERVMRSPRMRRGSRFS